MAVVPVLKSHQEDWSRKFEDEAAAVREAVGREALAIHHIGSTAIPGILAKPIIDMLVEVASLEGLDRHAASLGAGRAAVGWMNSGGRLALFVRDSAEILLRAPPALRRLAPLPLEFEPASCEAPTLHAQRPFHS